MWNSILAWLGERTGLTTGVRHFLYEDIRHPAGWHPMVGRVGVFGFVIQAVTGFLLALNYGSTPAEAHASLRYIMTELTGGAVIRGLHHWGSSAMLLVVLLHMAQTFLW